MVKQTTDKIDLKILLVEDHVHWQNILEAGVEKALKNIHYTGVIQKCSTFEEAWTAFESEGPWNLLITDIGLENRERESKQKLGLQLINRARDKHIECIVVSGTLILTNLDVRDLLKKYEVCDFFSKQNFENKRFVESIEYVLAGKSNVPNTSVNSGSSPIIDRVTLRNQINDHFSEGELRSLCFEMDIDYEMWSSLEKTNKIEVLIVYLHHRDRLSELRLLCQQLRPQLPW